ncbi:MAG: phosphorylase [Leptolyngbyaceae cyanobacterium bins.302]|nr:phosphorylase [Leptolyngbyaceae cyanobacterium bins.302]
MRPDIQAILVPQGAEYRAVCGGLRRVLHPPTVFPVPVGAIPLTRRLDRLRQANCLFRGQRILVMGLGGGLVPDLTIGAGVLYKSCIASVASGSIQRLECDRELTYAIQKSLGDSLKTVNAVTSDRVIWRAREKQQLAQQFQAQIVDMEGFSALQLLTHLGATVATLRVVSDDSRHDIPNLAQAFDSNGALKPAALAAAMFKQPIAGIRLIRGSTKSLKILQNLTAELFKNSF